MRTVTVFWRSVCPAPGACYREHWQLCERYRGKVEVRADVWLNEPDRCTWHTWDRRGNGGENSATYGREAKYEAMRCALAAVVLYESEHGGAVHWRINVPHQEKR